MPAWLFMNVALPAHWTIELSNIMLYYVLIGQNKSRIFLHFYMAVSKETPGKTSITYRLENGTC